MRVPRAHILALPLLVFGSLGVPIACSNGGDEANPSAMDASTADGGGRVEGFGDDEAGARGAGCSPDLRFVTDTTGKSVAECPTDRACAGGTCVPACEAAAVSRGSLGCDFLVATPVISDQVVPPSPCFAVFLANAGRAPAKVEVSFGATTLDATAFTRIPDGGPPARWAPLPKEGLSPGGVAVLFLSGDPQSDFSGFNLACPVPPAVARSELRGTVKGTAFRVKTTMPVSAYDIFPFGGSQSFLPSARLHYPVSTWGREFVVQAPAPGRSVSWTTAWMQVVAEKDGTVVEITPRVATEAGVVAATPSGQTARVTLAAGEFVQLRGAGPEADFAGTIVRASGPAYVQAGNSHYCLASQTSGGGGCESTHQPSPSVDALASEYVGAPYATRRADLQPESVPYRIGGVVDGTVLTYEPDIPGAPTTIGKGEARVFESTTPFVVRSQNSEHPFLFAQMMTGCNVTSGSRPGDAPAYASRQGYRPCLGDEEWVAAVPPSQFLQSYPFFTDPSFATTTLTITRVKGPSGFADVEVECVGKVTNFRDVGTSGRFQVAFVDLVRAGASQGACANGRQFATSEAPFGITVWGLDYYSSYGYPAGGNAASLNRVIIVK